jgi:hypothetical protein
MGRKAADQGVSQLNGAQPFDRDALSAEIAAMKLKERTRLERALQNARSLFA